MEHGSTRRPIGPWDRWPCLRCQHDDPALYAIASLSSARLWPSTISSAGRLIRPFALSGPPAITGCSAPSRRRAAEVVAFREWRCTNGRLKAHSRVRAPEQRVERQLGIGVWRDQWAEGEGQTRGRAVSTFSRPGRRRDSVRARRCEWRPQPLCAPAGAPSGVGDSRLRARPASSGGATARVRPRRQSGNVCTMLDEDGHPFRNGDLAASRSSTAPSSCIRLVIFSAIGRRQESR